MSLVKVSTNKVISKEIKKLFNQSITLPDGLITNDVIKKQFINMLDSSRIIPNSALKSIWNLVNYEVIIPVNIKKKGLLSWIDSIIKKSQVPFAYSYDEGTMAFYSGSTNRIYMLIDNIMRIDNNSNQIAITLTHELQHMQCHNFPNQFYTLHKQTINNFYYTLFKTWCDNKLPINKDSCEIFGRYLLYMFDDLFSSYGALISDSDFKSYEDKCKAVFLDRNTMKVPELGSKIAYIFTKCAESLIDGDYFTKAKINNSIQNIMYRAINVTYPKIGYNSSKLHSFFGQECIVPSEIIALKPNIKITPDLFAFLNRL